MENIIRDPVLQRRYTRLKKISLALAFPYLVLFSPITLPVFLCAYVYRKIKKSRNLSVYGKEYMVMRGTSSFDAPAPKLPIYVSRVTTQDVLIWGPLTISGLTTQVEQLAEILKTLNISFRISYYNVPEIDHPLRKYWIDPIDIKNPKVAIFMERYFPFDVGFVNSYHVFYLNLDWLRQDILSMSRAFADEVIVPTTYRIEEFREIYGASRVKYVPWPAACSVTEVARDQSENIEPIRVLYVGNDYNYSSRKNPHAVCEAISQTKNKAIVLDLKFRSKLPGHVKRRLEANPLVGNIIDYPITREEMTELYDAADVNLIPNDSEGNGLSILESFARGVVPAVLAGHPMVDVATKNVAFHIDCEEVGMKEFAPLYKTDTNALVRFFDSLNTESVRQRANSIPMTQGILRDRQVEFSNYINGVMTNTGVIRPEVSENIGEPWFKAKAEVSDYKTDIVIDVYMTTRRRPNILRRSLASLIAAIEASPFQHRLILIIDESDPETDAILKQWQDYIDLTLSSRDQMGLPYHWNMILDMSLNSAARQRRPASYICYLQDDCNIIDPSDYFGSLVRLAESIRPELLGLISGFHTDVHPGLHKTEFEGRDLIVSRSIDGKNLFGRTKTFYTVGKLSWWFPDGEPRGNPGPKMGSHFDLWQWRESPNSLSNQGRYCFIAPDLCEHIAQSPEDSTWNNDTTMEGTRQRLAKNKVYK